MLNFELFWNKSVFLLVLYCISVFQKCNDVKVVDWNSEFIQNQELICGLVKDINQRSKELQIQSIEGSLYFSGGVMHILFFGAKFLLDEELIDIFRNHDLLFSISFKVGNEVTDFYLVQDRLRRKVSYLQPSSHLDSEKHIHIAPYFQLLPTNQKEEFWKKNFKWAKFCHMK